MTINTFQDLNLSEFIQQAILDLKFTEPSAVQKEAIPHLLNNEDIIAMAPTGSGKTFAFAIPALEKIDMQDKSIQALILCPTRELTIQAHREFEKLTKFNEDIKVVSIYGGQQIEKQINALKRNPQVIIATPGRLMDHLRQKTISLENIKFVVLDEADEMLDMGFRVDIETILDQTNNTHQTVLFSATMEKDIRKIAEKFQKQPIIVDVLDNLQSIPDIEQFYIEVPEKNKPELVSRLLTVHNIGLSLVFCNTKSNVDKLVEILKAKGFSTDAIHGDMNQTQREKVMGRFKKGSIKILVATDVAGRGIDVKNIEAVLNYDLPRDDEDYVHRVGRTGRAGKSGMAFSLVSRRQVSILKKIEKANGIKITEQEVPSYEDLEKANFNKYTTKLENLINDTELDSYREKISKLTEKGFSELDIAAALYKLLSQKEQSKINRNMVFEKEPEMKSEGRRRNRSRGSRGGSNSRNSRNSNSKPKFNAMVKFEHSKPKKKSKSRY